MSSRPHDPERDEPQDDDADWVDRLSSERRRRAREWEKAFFDQDDEARPSPRPRRRRTTRSPDDGVYDQDREPGS